MNKFLGAIILTMMTSSLVFAANFSCSEQKKLSMAPELTLFGFAIEKLDLSARVDLDQTRRVIRGSCVFQVFFMFDYDPAVHEPGWYLPYSVTVDADSSTIYQEGLTTTGAKRQIISKGMNVFRNLLNNCECKIP